MIITKPQVSASERAKDVGIEVQFPIKTYNMTGWRIGFAVGNPEILAGLGKVKPTWIQAHLRLSRMPV